MILPPVLLSSPYLNHKGINQCAITYHTVTITYVAKVDRDGRRRPQMIPGHGVLAPVGRASDLSKVWCAVASAQTTRSDRLPSAERNKGWVIIIGRLGQHAMSPAPHHNDISRSPATIPWDWATEMIVTIMRHKCIFVSLSVDIKNCIYANHLIKGGLWLNGPCFITSSFLLFL